MAFAKTSIRKFHNRYAINPKTGCWDWTGCMGSGGYGAMMAFGESSAHRVSYVIHIGDIDNGDCVMHKCDVSG